jgi:pimeloyl-ACP methyl ester carboxylesterase
MRLKLKYDQLLSNFAFNLNVRHYALRGATAHRGMAKAARWLVANNLSMLKDMLARGGPGPERRLTVLGHSLGAGSAAIAAVLLHEHFPTLRCVAFATPPCLDFPAGVACAPFLTSVVGRNGIFLWNCLQSRFRIPELSASS